MIERCQYVNTFTVFRSKSDRIFIDPLLTCTFDKLMRLMEKDGLDPIEDRVYVCSECFGKLVSFMLTNPGFLKQGGLPSSLRAIPLVEGEIEPCEKCNTSQATAYIPCLPPSQIERVQRECERESWQVKTNSKKQTAF